MALVATQNPVPVLRASVTAWSWVTLTVGTRPGCETISLSTWAALMHANEDLVLLDAAHDERGVRPGAEARAHAFAGEFPQAVEEAGLAL
jgi:hypothetical protein